ncbi:hypothetical protein TESG_08395 [Trichophyton tonsurans CBS 112818]|uniref:Uncharacterized protein n=1 Tax=Trichophyton tonsurans (strain CBS 112818) TaxID=647933 RepID=F2RWA6_TRIT1|nr:hypothetical protein TESG_08395 [Trichophyton tonsurans CBS 112818]
MVRLDGELVHLPEEKAEVLHQSFFLPLYQADLSDIEGYEYPLSIEYPDITTAEVERAVRRTSPNKALGADGITDGILHQTLNILLLYLCKLFNTCLEQGYCPRHFKNSITVVLRKPSKALEAIVANRLAYIADVYYLLLRPEGQQYTPPPSTPRHGRGFPLMPLPGYSTATLPGIFLAKAKGAEAALNRLKIRQLHVVLLWWTPPFVRISETAEDAIKEHDAIEPTTIHIYTDGSVYVVELKGLVLALQIILNIYEAGLAPRKCAIFTNNQAAI